MFRDRRESCQAQRNPFGHGGEAGVPNASAGFEQFHHTQATKARQVQVPEVPKELYVIGRLLSFVYLPPDDSKKPHQPHVHELGDYGTHKNKDVSTYPLITADKNNELVIIRDKSDYYIDSRGVIG